MVLHMCFESWYISKQLSAKHHREMIKFHVFWNDNVNRAVMTIFLCLPLEINVVTAHLALAGF